MNGRPKDRQGADAQRGGTRARPGLVIAMALLVVGVGGVALLRGAFEPTPAAPPRGLESAQRREREVVAEAQSATPPPAPPHEPRREAGTDAGTPDAGPDAEKSSGRGGGGNWSGE